MAKLVQRFSSNETTEDKSCFYLIASKIVRVTENCIEAKIYVPLSSTMLIF
jgi:hypothetical protein